MKAEELACVISDFKKALMKYDIIDSESEELTRIFMKDFLMTYPGVINNHDHADDNKT